MKTLADIKKCPIDYLYLWASDEFISQLGSKGKIIKKKRYYQYQTLYKAVVENVKKDSAIDSTYDQVTKEIAELIKDTYGLTPGEILVKLAMGEQVAGKDFKNGVFGVGATNSTSFGGTGVTVDSVTGNLMKSGQVLFDFADADMDNFTFIYGQDGRVSGYSTIVNGTQYQVGVSYGDDGTVLGFSPASYSDSNGVYNPDGSSFNSKTGSFWQNANNYIPMINKILDWISSIVNSFFPNRTYLTTENTVPLQTEWVEESDNTGLLIAGGAILAGVILSMDNPFKK